MMPEITQSCIDFCNEQISIIEDNREINGIFIICLSAACLVLVWLIDSKKEKIAEQMPIGQIEHIQSLLIDFSGYLQIGFLFWYAFLR